MVSCLMSHAPMAVKAPPHPGCETFSFKLETPTHLGIGRDLPDDGKGQPLHISSAGGRTRARLAQLH